MTVRLHDILPTWTEHDLQSAEKPRVSGGTVPFRLTLTIDRCRFKSLVHAILGIRAPTLDTAVADCRSRMDQAKMS
jgi:hypothetical protein